MVATWTVEEEMTTMRQRSGAEMRKKLEWYDLMAMGVGGMLGAGVFVTTGTVAHQNSGPAVVLSYIVAGVSALLSAFCYTEFAVEMPVAGGAFSYLRITFGEFAGYFAGANLVLEYVLSNAAVARSFTSYFSNIFGVSNGDAWRIRAEGLADGYNMLDFPAVALVMLLTLCICRSTKESSVVNMAATLFHLLMFAFIIVAGFANGHFHNLTRPSGFAPYGAKGVFEGAAIVYFSYIGYDSVSTLAEEIKRPAQSLPLGVSGSVIIVSLVYCLVALSLCVLVPYDQISTSAAFSEAFKKSVGWRWGSNVVAVGAALGILTSLLVAMLGQARYLCVFGRAHLIPSWFARVHPKTGTPINATLCLGFCTAAIALFTELSIVLNMISIGTLVVFYVVANALIYHRHVHKGATKPLPTLAFLTLFSLSATGFALCWQLEKHGLWGLLTFGSLSVLLITAFKLTVPIVHHPKDWGVPLMPWFPAASIFLNVFLLSTLDRWSYARFGLWTIFLLFFYIFFSVHATHDAEASSKQDHATTMQDVHNKDVGVSTGRDDQCNSESRLE
ncbi:cationic amino acid transporter 6, chloroplastic-like [Cryptomeria japonica]|uniref:cationic amino acid transporter 6, chloroplastic-like n=1 Tax=Cryptomeria japonica TaxID=3369 RepID=UPI0025AD60F8|nr:cationic amino acid transporter 6, chloroplastic-like [Cryptomeria japonica]